MDGGKLILRADDRAGGSVRQRLLRSVRRSVVLTSAAFLTDNLLAAMKVTRADPAPDEHLAGADVEADIAYSRSVAAMYMAAAPGLGGTVAELGPGGSAATALSLLEQGCEHVDLVDRFAFARSEANMNDMYRRIIAGSASLSSRFGARADLAPDVTAYVGEAAAAERFFETHRDYDAIVSCAVLEHLYDPIRALVAMAGALKPGGLLLHQVDLRDHGMFTSGGHHPLTFLTLPHWLYSLMSRRRGRPNRVLVHRYREALEALPLAFEITVTDLVGVGPIEPARWDDIPEEPRRRAEAEVQAIRPRLAARFARLPDRDLAVAGFFITARKRGA